MKFHIPETDLIDVIITDNYANEIDGFILIKSKFKSDLYL